jgi:hypothetical protein
VKGTEFTLKQLAAGDMPNILAPHSTKGIRLLVVKMSVNKVIIAYCMLYNLHELNIH